VAIRAGLQRAGKGAEHAFAIMLPGGGGDGVRRSVESY